MDQRTVDLINQLGVVPEHLTYDYRTRRGVLYLPAGTCGDMTGCIALFEQIDPAVLEVDTIAGRHLDTYYIKFKDGTWNAYSMASV